MRLLPALPGQNTANRAIAYSILPSQTAGPRSGLLVLSANGIYLELRQLGASMPLALRHPFGMKPESMLISPSDAFSVQSGSVTLARSHSLFHHCVTSIVSRSAQKKMGGPNTDRIVAAVANKQSLGDRAMDQLPGNAVSRNIFLVALGSKAAITPRAFFTRPFPARVSLSDARPETAGYWLYPRIMAALTRAVALWIRRQSRQEFLSAVVAVTGNWGRLWAHHDLLRRGATLRAAATAPEHCSLLSSPHRECFP